MKIVTALFVASAAVLPAFAADTPNMDVVVSGKTAPTVEIAFWTENGKQMLARGEDAKKAPPGAVHLVDKIFNMGGLTLREVQLPKGADFAPPAGTNDTLIYVQSGRVKVKSGDVEREASAGDTIREYAGRSTHFMVEDATVFIETPIPTQPK